MATDDNDPSGTPAPWWKAPYRPDISAVQQGDRRVEYHRPDPPAPPPLHKVREGMGAAGRFISEAVALVIILAFGAAMSLLAFSVGVDYGTEKGAAACAAGDSVAVDRAVSAGE